MTAKTALAERCAGNEAYKGKTLTQTARVSTLTSGMWCKWRKLATEVKSNPKSFYRYVRSKTKSKARVGPLKDSAGNAIDDNKEYV